MTKKKNTPKKGTKSARVRVIVPRPRGLDDKALAYARLLTDPCGAGLVQPVYPGGEAGFLFRADSIATYGGGATETAGIVHWTPGYTNSSNSDLLVGGATGPSTPITLASSGTGPGKSFLGANAAGVRCVAACLKVTFPGSESARAGRVHYGHTVAGIMDSGNTTDVDALAPVLQHYSRTPADTIELLWKPGISDTEFNDPNTAASATLRDRKSSLTVAWAGVPGGTGMTFHYTAIYEWMPKVDVGVSTNVNGKSTSSNTLDDILDAIKEVGFNWVKHPGGTMGNLSASRVRAPSAAGLMAFMASTYGRMAARQVNMPAIRYRG
jgi:hypothetical protein